LTPKLPSSVNVSALAKKAETLYLNTETLISRHSLSRIGFVTLTFSRHVTDHKQASRAFSALYDAHLKPLGWEFITVPERQSSGRVHFHLICAFPDDIRTGFDFETCKLANEAKRAGDNALFRKYQSEYSKSANSNLRNIWAFFRSPAVTKYGFGRCETLPVLSNATALARYVGAYVTTAGERRVLADKGVRSVRYSMQARSASIRWSWADGPGLRWRRGLQVLGLFLQMDLEQIKARFGNRWGWKLKDHITILGNNYEKALSYVSMIPDWADYNSRLGFASTVCAQFSGQPVSVLPKSNFLTSPPPF